MLKNYLKIVVRNLRRHKGYTFINIAGLALGLACCILIALYVRDELSYDDFHEHADRIAFVGITWSYGGETSPSMSTPYPLAGALVDEVPGVEKAVRTLWPSTGEVSRNGQTFSEEEGVFYVEHSFFDVFSFPLVQGDPATALERPNTAVISEELARKYFPDENPVGQTLHVKEQGEHAVEITGVAQSRKNSFLDFGAVLSFSTLDYAKSHADVWNMSMFLTFAVLEDGVSVEQFDAQGLQRVNAHLGEDTEHTFFAQPITGLYLSDLVLVEGFRGEQRYLYLFGAVAFFILLLACVNYVNLATARSAQRAKEVGVRRTVGAGRAQVARQFLGESVLMSLLAFLVAVGLARTALPVFNHLFDKKLALFGGSGSFFLLLLSAVVGVGLLAGAYPALYLSGFQPTEVLRGSTRRIGRGARLRKGLVVVQFAVTVALLIATAVVFQQLRFTQQKDLGFQKEQVVTTDVPSEGTEAFRRKVLTHPGVVSATLTNGVPGGFSLGMNLKPGTVSSEARADTAKSISFKPAVVDYAFVETLGLELVAGRAFSRAHASDEERAYLLNETAATALGWTPEEAVGKPLRFAGGGEVIGVVKDFHITSLREQIEPVVLSLHGFEGVSASSQLAARLAPSTVRAGLRHIKETHARFTDEPFEYAFLDDEFAAMYRTEQRLGQVFTAFAIVAVLIACLGLFGLAAFAAEARTKEIGIRKVLGASAASIVALLSKDFLKLVLVAFVVAAPLAYVAMRRWLEDFAYRIDLGPGVFLLAGAAALGIALLTVSYQAFKAARANPTEALRSE